MATLNTATKKAKRTASQTAAHLGMARRAAVNGGRDVAHDLRETAQDHAHQAVESARRYGRDKTHELYDRAQNAFDRGIGDIDKLVRNNPVTALAAALAIGFVLGARR